MEKGLSASNFMKQVNYYHQCYCDTLKFGMNPEWKFWGFGLINYIQFHWELDDNGDTIVYFGIYEDLDSPEVLVFCMEGTSQQIFMGITKGLEEYYFLKSKLE